MNLATIGKKPEWLTLLWWSAIALALLLMIRADLQQLNWVSALSLQGSPPPARDASSPTGYVLDQRHFLGKHERGDTYRWIAATQELIAAGPFASPTYEGDTVPTGRPQLMPKLYAGWLATIAGGVHVVAGAPVSNSVEQAALWEPVISHALAFAAAVAFMAIRYGPVSAAATALVFAFFPPVFGQFLPGALTARTWALLLSAYAIALTLPAPGQERRHLAFSARSAVAASLALWLDPACGFPAVLVTSAAGAATIFTQTGPLSFLRWSLVGSGVTLAAWLIERNPWALAAGELRYVHPLYALAWLGIGLTLDGSQHLRTAGRMGKLRIAEITGGALLVSILGYVQIEHDYKGWFYPSVSLRRITSLDETTAFDTALAWLRHASAAEAALLSAPIVVAVAALIFAMLRGRTRKNAAELALAPAAVAFAALLALAFARVRWGVVVSLAALPLVSHVVTRDLPGYRRTVAYVAGAVLFGLILWGQDLPESFKRPAAAAEPSPADFETLLYRHFSHWLASHTPGQKVAALAPPELSDSIVFHGGGQVLMSTAWESYPGQLAARRILSALESTEAEAVLQGRELTHVILPSWDKVLPLFVQAPAEPGKDTLFDRLRRWVFPPYLRPVAYHLPPMAAFAAQNLAVFKVTPPQDEPLMLSRLAEYFVEMERAEPAAMVARVLAEAYANDPNAAIGRATVYAHGKHRAEFEREVERLAADATAGRSPFSWDRRVQRAIVLALGRQRELARAEIEACLATASEADLLELTPLQAYRLGTLTRALGLAFPDPKLAALAASLGAEYAPRNENPSKR